MTYLEKKATGLWQQAMTLLWRGQCAMCTLPGDAGHHIIGRTYLDSKFSLMNGIFVCTSCHQWCDDNQEGLVMYLELHRPALYKWHVENKPIIMKSSTWHNTVFFHKRIEELQFFIKENS